MRYCAILCSAGWAGQARLTGLRKRAQPQRNEGTRGRGDEGARLRRGGGMDEGDDGLTSVVMVTGDVVLGWRGRRETDGEEEGTRRDGERWVKVRRRRCFRGLV